MKRIANHRAHIAATLLCVVSLFLAMRVHSLEQDIAHLAEWSARRDQFHDQRLASLETTIAGAPPGWFGREMAAAVERGRRFERELCVITPGEH